MDKRFAVTGVLVSLLALPALAVEQRHGVLVGEVIRLDSAARTFSVRTARGTEHTLRFMERTDVHGIKDAAAGASDTFHGIRKGSEVAVHYTAKGSEETAREIDNIGKDGLKSADVTVIHVDRGAKLLTVKTAEGGRETYRLTDNAARDTGKDIGEGTDKSAKVTVYYGEEAGRKVVHFFKRAI